MRQANDAGQAEASTDAINNPVKRAYNRREVLNTDTPPRVLDALEDLADREPDIIVADKSMASGDYLAELAFMEEPVTIVMHRGREKNAPTHEMVSVNGRNIWVQVETPTRLARKYVEVMARAQPMTVSTASGESPGDELAFNRTSRSLSAAFAFSVIEDKNPRGGAWLSKVMRES